MITFNHSSPCLCVQIVFQNAAGKYELEVTTFQMGVLFAWNQRQDEKISFESLRYSKLIRSHTHAPAFDCVCVKRKHYITVHVPQHPQ